MNHALKGKASTAVFALQFRPMLPEYMHLLREKGHYTFESEHIRQDSTISPVLIDITTVTDEVG